MPTDEPEILPNLNADPEPVNPETDDGPQKSPHLREEEPSPAEER